MVLATLRACDYFFPGGLCHIKRIEEIDNWTGRKQFYKHDDSMKATEEEQKFASIM